LFLELPVLERDSITQLAEEFYDFEEWNLGYAAEVQRLIFWFVTVGRWATAETVNAVGRQTNKRRVKLGNRVALVLESEIFLLSKRKKESPGAGSRVRRPGP